MAAFLNSERLGIYRIFSGSVRLAEEIYARVTQEQIGDISDLDISDFNDMKTKMRILNTTIQHSKVRRWSAETLAR